MRCSLKGKYKKDFQLKKSKLYHTDIVTVGDEVSLDLNNDGSGIIHTIGERRNYLSRKAPRIRGASYRGERLEQVVASNIDNFFIISSVDEPPFNNRVIDRFIVAGESSNINMVIIINKIDLDDMNKMDTWINLYDNIGYNVIKTSTLNSTGLPELASLLKNKTNIFWGQSGVGKSSLLNKIYPHLNLETSPISNSTFKGVHTTVTSKLFEVETDTFLIDTPGIREIDPFGIKKEDLSHYFIEFKAYAAECKFSTCTHHHEPDCKVRRAVEQSKISKERYDSYLRLLETIEEDIIF
ncbi:MAG: ribosome small subunit-dependent GTPase A [Ignavibacteriaceae bacterium]|nr:ribosome small subunit-dependent GTPase A [Ignavibacteriaceae bacterium]